MLMKNRNCLVVCHRARMTNDYDIASMNIIHASDMSNYPRHLKIDHSLEMGLNPQFSSQT